MLNQKHIKKSLERTILFEDIEDILRHISAQYNVEFIPQRAFEGNETHYNFIFIQQVITTKIGVS